MPQLARGIRTRLWLFGFAWTLRVPQKMENYPGYALRSEPAGEGWNRMKNRLLIAEAVGTALLVFFGAGTATLAFGFKTAGSSISAGVVATALAFGLVLLALIYALGPVSGCHVNPAVTIGFLVGRKITFADAIGYWIAQFVGAIAGAAVLYGTFNLASGYKKSVGLGANGFGAS